MLQSLTKASINKECVHDVIAVLEVGSEMKIGKNGRQKACEIA